MFSNMKRAGQQWISFNFNGKETKAPKKHSHNPHSQDEDSKHSHHKRAVATKRSFNFEFCIKPRSIADLAVHPKKISEVQAWLQKNVTNECKTSHDAKFLLITGPTGSGKTATVQVLCDMMKINIIDWSNPVDQDFEIYRGPGQVTRFMEFLSESRWNSLFSTSDKKIILVEDFPNVLLRDPDAFANVLEDCCYKIRYPVVFICTDSCDNRNLSQTLFPVKVTEQYGMAHISFNACATTMMKTALRRAHDLVQQYSDLFRVPSASTADAVISTSMGDIRCAINQYYFASLLGSDELPMVISSKSRKGSNKRKRKEINTSVKVMFRDENVGLFHGLGRVLNPKLIEHGGGFRLNCDFDKLIDEFSTQPGTFTAFLFENYVNYFGELDDAMWASEALSLSQTFLQQWVDRHDIFLFAMWISILGLMIHNKHRTSKWNQIRGPKRINNRIRDDPMIRDLSSTDLFYYNIIMKREMTPFSVK